MPLVRVAFQNCQRLEMCGAPKREQRGWSICTRSRVHIPDVLLAVQKSAIVGEKLDYAHFPINCETTSPSPRSN
jgi:hypothetical protein